MPSVVNGGSKKNGGVGGTGTGSILNRSESLRSEFSDASTSKKVSFNKDVRIRRIPQNAGNGNGPGTVHGQVVAVLEPPNPSRGTLATGPLTSGCLWINSKVKNNSIERDLLAEAESILSNVDKIQCTSSVSASAHDTPKKRFLERSKSEIIPTVFRRAKSEPPPLPATGVSKFLDVNLSPQGSGGSGSTSKSGVGQTRNKPIRIKKPRKRVGLDGISGDSSSSGSERRGGGDLGQVSLDLSVSESPLSSISSDHGHGHGDTRMATTPRYGSTPRVSSLASKFNSSGSRRENAGPPLRSSFHEASNGNTHNNNKPFSYTGNGKGHGGSGGGVKAPWENGHGHSGKTPREVIYAQVVSREKKDGTPEKRTIHKKYSDLTTSTSTPADSPADFQKHIRHFVYDKENWKNLNESHNSLADSSHLLSTYQINRGGGRGGGGGSQYGSKNNVTTVLLNSNDEEDSLRSTTITNNDLFKNSSRSSSSPPRLSEHRPFFYGDTRLGRVKTFDHSSSSSPQFQYSSSSREQSPAGITRPVQPAGTATSTTAAVPPINLGSTNLSSTKVTSTRNHTDYQYMNNKLGYLTPSEYSMEVTRLPPRPKPTPNPNRRPASMDRIQPRYEQVKVNGWSKPNEGSNHSASNHSASNRTASNRTASADYKRSNGGYNYPTYEAASSNATTIEATNRKNSQDSIKKSDTFNGKGSQKVAGPGSGSGGGSSGGGGIISTLMRRNKDKKVKDKGQINGGSTTVGKVKPRNKFLSLFFDSKTGSKKSDKLNGGSRNGGTGSGNNKLKHIVTDSEIDDAERKRDGEYHSWSSVDGSYHLDLHKTDQRQKDKLSRGKSYNFGEKPTPTDPWYQDSEDYRRDLAKTNYKSVTLGRPVTRSVTQHEADLTSRTKSLDRRTLRPRFDHPAPPPKLVITPSSPPVDENGYRWESTYPVKSKLDHKLSKSSVELNSHSRGYSADRGRDHDHGRDRGRDNSPRVNKLRYFGDTDAESGGGGGGSSGMRTTSTLMRHNSRFDSPSSSFGRTMSGKMDQGYGQNGSENHHISRRDGAQSQQRKGRNDGLSSEESESRLSKSSSRSVFLHAPTVAEIPPPGGLQRRTLSKDEISNYSGSQKQTRHLARSMSVLAPWRPRPKSEKYEVRYDNEGYKDSKYRRPPKPPRSPNRPSNSPIPSIKRRSESSENLLQGQEKSREVNKASTLGRFSGGTLKRSKSTANDSFSGSAWLPRRKENQRK